MNAKQMVLALNTFGNLIGGSEAAALFKFAEVFDGMGEVKATAVAAQVAKNWKAYGRAAKRPAELEKAVRGIEQALAATGAKAQAGVFAKVLAILVGSDNQDIDGFVREAIDARVKKAPPPKPEKVKPPKVSKPKFADLAPELAQKLLAVAYDRGRFDVLLKDYEERYKPSELKAIAHRLPGLFVNSAKKVGIVKAVRNWQREEELNSHSHTSQANVGL
jgi:hypothetical protein